MVHHPKTMQMVTNQRWHELQVRVARERLGMITLLAAGNREISQYPTRCRIGAAWSTVLASVTFVLRSIPRISQEGWTPIKEAIVVQHVVADSTYVLGRSDAEARCLMLQSRLFHRISRRFLADAGIAPGMTILAVGSGAGDASFAAADLIGPHGHVIGVDLNPEVLETARARSRPG
jgi:hypothetical protein